ncbi:GTPase-associated protein 1-related protein [Streptomyces sp. NPDC057854]|uniref:GTPase-associated protein 1-related protein n=1 Tax=unclassified Streptomyces TaxID=2593676 RepID=UPI0036CEB3A5
MSLPQMHYTSAPPGPDGSGFRFTAVSPGVPPSVLREAEQLVGYEPPRDAPSRPTDAELGSFPEMFGFARLSDGSGLLSRTVYTGADYSGRWGNFHAHALLVPAGTPLPGDLPPIALWGAAEWADRTPEDVPPAPLDRLTPRIPPGLGGELAAFAAELGPRLAAVLADLRRVAEDPAAPQVVLAETDTRAVAHWLMLATGALPRDAARALTFTTYTRRPQHARQQVVGVRPEDARAVTGQPHRYAVHDRADTRAEPPATGDVWALTAAAVWAAGADALFKRAQELPGAGPFAAGPLAALALAAGVPVPAGAYAPAAAWATGHPGALGEDELERFLRAVCAEGRPGSLAPGDLAALLTALRGTVPLAVTAPITARLVDAAVRDPAVAPPPLPPGALPEPHRSRLAAGLGEAVRAGIGTPGTPLPRTAGLLRIARTLGVDHGDLLPGLADRLCRRVVDGPGRDAGDGTGGVPELPDLIGESAPLRDLLLDLLEARAADHPVAVADGLRTTPLPPDGLGARPHLRMCAALAPHAARAGNRTPALHTLLRASGGSHLADPRLLRTAVHLLWQDRGPTAEEASQLLGESGPEVHRAAGTWDDLVSAAVDAPADDTAAPTLAKQLLTHGRDAVGRAAYGDLALLAHVHTLEHADTDPSAPHGNLVERARSLSSQARPAAQARAARALARLLLRADRPPHELRALAYSNDPGLIDAYAEAARSPVLTDFLTVPSRLADCYLAWHSHESAGPVWNLTRRELLEEVLRPAVRKMPDDQLRLAAEHVGRHGPAHRDLFEEWARPSGGVKQLFRRFGGRRQDRAREPRWGDVERPRDGGR